ncbi:MAG: VOC family protein [Oscillospiraceae bacterium]|nr:VOC family protein [Oscillospiraceae bacterium]
MRIDKVTACVQVRNDFGTCFDFYTGKLGLVPIYGDRNGPYANFANCKDGEPFFAMYSAKDASERIAGYTIPDNTRSSDTLSAVFHTTDFEDVYNNWLKAGVEFIDRVVMGEGDETFNMAIFSDPEGNMLSLEDGGV